MPLYDVYVRCDQCGQPHSVHVQLTLDDPDLHRTPLKDVFTGDDMPPSVVFMRSNNYRCPHTKKLFSASNIDDSMLISV